MGLEYLDAQLRKEILVNGAETILRPNLDFIQGSGTSLAVVDDPITKTTKLTITASGGLPSGTQAGQVATWNGSAWIAGTVALGDTDAVSGTLPIARGGTGGTGAANTVFWSDGAANAFTSTPTVVSLTATTALASATIAVTSKLSLTAGAGDFIALGATPATTGAIRLTNNFKISWKPAVGSDVPGVYLDGTNQLWLDATNGTHAWVNAASGGSAILAVANVAKVSASGGQVALSVNTVVWDTAVASPILVHNARSTDAACTHLTIQPQEPFASATGANRTPGSCIVNIAAPTNGSTTEAYFQVNRGGSFRGAIGPFDAASFSALWLGPGITPTSANYTIASNGTNSTFFNAASGTMNFVFAGALGMSLTTTTLTFTSQTSAVWAEAVVNPLIRQNTRTTDAAPQNLRLGPQGPFSSATGANRNPGSLIVELAAPTAGGTTEGRVEIQRGGSFQCSIAYYGSGNLVAQWFGSGITPSGTNFAFLGDGNVQTFLNVPSNSGAVCLSTGGTTANGFKVYQTRLGYHEGSARSIQQDQRTTDAATFALTIQGQDAFASATGTNRNGANVIIGGGVKASGGVDGIVQLKSGTTNACYVAVTSFTALGFNDSATTVFIARDTRGSDAATQLLSINGQDAFASATGTNRNGGHVNIGGGFAVGGQVNGSVRLQMAGTTVFEVGGTTSSIAFFAGGLATKQTVTGSRGGNAALASLLTALSTYGLVTDSSTA